jgi:putative ABC transport system permease protein
VLVVASIALGVAIWTATGALDRSLQAALHSAATPLAGTADLYVSNGDLGVSRDLATSLVKLPGVRSVDPILVQRVLLPGLGGRPALLLGIDLEARRSRAERSSVRLSGLAPTAYLRAKLLGSKPVLVGRELERALPRGATRIDVLASGSTHRLTRVGTVEAEGAAAALGGNVLLADDRDVAALLGRPGLVSRLDLALNPEIDRDEVRRRVEKALAGRATVATPEAQDQRIMEVLAGLNVGFSLCGMGALALGLFLIYNALNVSLMERQREIGILRALGASRRRVRSQYLGEAAVLGLIGSAIGLALGWGLARLALGPLLRAMSDIFLPLHAQTPQFSSATLIGGMAAGVASVLLAALGPTLRATSTSPIEAMHRARPWRGSEMAGVLAGAGVALVALGIAGSLARGPLPQRVATYGVLILELGGALLLIPLATSLVALVLRPALERLFGIAGRLAADQLVRDPGRVGLTVSALAAGVALVLQTGGVIHGNEEAIRAWVDQGVAGDLFVTSGGPLSASGQILPMPEELGDRLRTEFPGVAPVPFRFRYLNWDHDGREIRILMLALDARAFHDANEGRKPPLRDLALYRQLSEPATVLVSENFAALHTVRVGDTIRLPARDGPLPLRVIGTVTDFACSHGEVQVDRASLGRQFEAEQVDVFSVFLPATADVERVRERILRTPWAADQALCVLTHDEMRTHILGMIHRIHAVAYLQEAVAGIVAALGVISALMISVLQRQRELGMLRAVGATRAQVLATILGEACLMVLISILLGLELGFALEWYVLRVILLRETGFVFPVQFPWMIAGVICVTVLLIGLLAGLGPGLRASRMRIAEAVAYE